MCICVLRQADRQLNKRGIFSVSRVRVSMKRTDRQCIKVWSVLGEKCVGVEARRKNGRRRSNKLDKRTIEIVKYIGTNARGDVKTMG